MIITFAFLMSLICIQLFACNKNEIEQTINPNNTSNTDVTKMRISIGEKNFTTSLYNDATAKAFKAKLPMTIKMTQLNGNEKHFDLSNARA
jgi:hypothetical protein